MGTNKQKLQGKLEQAGGKAAEKIGQATGNRDLEGQGRGKAKEGELREAAAKAAERAKGVGEQVKGKVKEVAGRVTGDRGTEAEGKAGQIKGKARDELNK